MVPALGPADETAATVPGGRDCSVAVDLVGRRDGEAQPCRQGASPSDPREISRGSGTAGKTEEKGSWAEVQGTHGGILGDGTSATGAGVFSSKEGVTDW